MGKRAMQLFSLSPGNLLVGPLYPLVAPLVNVHSFTQTEQPRVLEKTTAHFV